MVVCVVWSSSTTINALEVQRYELTCDCMPNKKRKIINREIEAGRISPTKKYGLSGMELKEVPRIVPARHPCSFAHQLLKHTKKVNCVSVQCISNSNIPPIIPLRQLIMSMCTSLF